MGVAGRGLKVTPTWEGHRQWIAKVDSEAYRYDAAVPNKCLLLHNVVINLNT